MIICQAVFLNNLIFQININLNSGSNSQAQQTANIMIGFEKYLTSNLTDLVLVVGDVTSTMAVQLLHRN